MLTDNNSDHKPASSARGFTLIELLVSIAILGLLATLAVPLTQTAQQRKQEQQLRFALQEIRHAIDAYKRAGSEGHIAVSATMSGYPPDLNTLVEGVIDQRDPMRNKMYFLRRIPRDPMNPDPEVSESASWRLRSYASEASDPREGEDVYDIYSTSTKTGLNGASYSDW